MDRLRSYAVSKSISVISGRWEGDNEKLCALELRFRLKRFPTPVCFESGTARSAGQRFTY